MILIKKIKSEKTYPLRIEILRNGIAENYHFVGDNLKTTFHLGAYDNDLLIGIVTFIKKEHPKLNDTSSYQLRGMAVSQKLQKQGTGKLLVRESYRFLKDKKCNLLWCNAREIAVGFYHNLEFTIIGDHFQIPKIGKHFTMFKSLKE